MPVLSFDLPGGPRVIVSERNHFDVVPLDHDALAALLADPSAQLPIVIRDVLEADLEGVPIPSGPRSTATFPLTLNAELKFFGLVVGGWVPPILGNGRVALLDRNMVYRLRNRPPPNPEPDLEDRESPAWLYRIFAESHFEVSPAIFLLEGSKRRAPTLDEMTSEMQSLLLDLKARLPNAKLHELGPVELQALHGLQLDRIGGNERTISFLLEVAPLVAMPVKAEKRRAVEDQVFAAAARAAVQRSSLSVVAALSCLYEDPQSPPGCVYRPGRAVLKPKPQYSEQDAYNANADLDALELLVSSTTLLVGYHGVFFTEDVGLVAFWTALSAKHAYAEPTSPGKARTTVVLTLTKALVPSLSEDERAELGLRLAG